MRYVELRAMGTAARVPWPIADAMMFTGAAEALDGYQPLPMFLLAAAEDACRRWARRTFGWDRRRTLATCALCATVALTLLALVPSVARAAGVLDVVTNPLQWLSDKFSEPIKEVYTKGLAVCLNDHLTSLAEGKALDVAIALPFSSTGAAAGSLPVDNEALKHAWDFLFVGRGSLYALTKVLANTILSIVLGVKMLRLIQEPDHNQNGFPYLEKIAWMALTFALLKTALDKAIPLSSLIFNTVNNTLTLAIANVDVVERTFDAAETAVSIVDACWMVVEGAFLAKVILVGIRTLLLFAAIAILDLTASFAIVTRYLQLFIYLVFAPLFFAFAGLEETRSMFIGYLKSIFSFGLAFTITVIVLKLVPVVFVPSFTGMTSDNIGMKSGNIIVTFLVLEQCLIHAGAWAHDLIGG